MYGGNKSGRIREKYISLVKINQVCLCKLEQYIYISDTW